MSKEGFRNIAESIKSVTDAVRRRTYGPTHQEASRAFEDANERYFQQIDDTLNGHPPTYIEIQQINRDLLRSNIQRLKTEKAR